MDNASRVINGTYGEAWLDGNKMFECYGAVAKTTFSKEEINMCGQLTTDTKVKSIKNSGELKLHKVNSRMAQVAEAMARGKDMRFTVILKLADPDAYGAERVALYGVSFDEVVLMDYEAATMLKTSCPFTFTRFEYLDKVEVR